VQFEFSHSDQIESEIENMVNDLRFHCLHWEDEKLEKKIKSCLDYSQKVNRYSQKIEL
jgi:hypothetical protein